MVLIAIHPSPNQPTIMIVVINPESKTKTKKRPQQGIIVRQEHTANVSVASSISSVPKRLHLPLLAPNHHQPNPKPHRNSAQVCFRSH